jgi:hypothetical protein
VCRGSMTWRAMCARLYLLLLLVVCESALVEVPLIVRGIRPTEEKVELRVVLLLPPHHLLELRPILHAVVRQRLDPFAQLGVLGGWGRARRRRRLPRGLEGCHCSVIEPRSARTSSPPPPRSLTHGARQAHPGTAHDTLLPGCSTLGRATALTTLAPRQHGDGFACLRP